MRSLNHQNCCSGTTGRAKEAEWRQNHYHGGGSRVAVVAEWRHSGRHSDRSMNAIGRPKEAQWWYKGGISIAQIGAQCLQLYGLLHRATNGRPMCIHFATTTMSVPSFCLLWATCERPTFSANFMRLFWTSMARFERPLCHPWMTKATFLPPLCLQRRSGQFYGRTREAQRSV